MECLDIGWSIASGLEAFTLCGVSGTRELLSQSQGDGTHLYKDVLEVGTSNLSSTKPPSTELVPVGEGVCLAVKNVSQAGFLAHQHTSHPPRGPNGDARVGHQREDHHLRPTARERWIRGSWFGGRFEWVSSYIFETFFVWFCPIGWTSCETRSCEDALAHIS